MTKTDKDEKNLEIVQGYLATRKIVIADPNKSSRNGIAKTLVEMGARTSNIALCSQYEEANAQILETKPDVVIADYDFGKTGGLSLIEEQRAQRPTEKQLLSVIITANTSQSAVAQAAEEDVDSFILKPYTVEVMKKCFLNAILTKVTPSPYLVAIEEGKQLLFGGNPAKAKETFESAKKLDPRPTLACFYAGQAELMQKMADEAGKNYRTGLGFNKIHYKCLVGLFDLLMEKKSYQEAYDCMKKIAQYFPANPKRLGSVIRLAIMTRSVEDMERYYQIFTSLETRSSELTKYICAGLIVCARYYIRTKNNSRALDLFNKAGVSCAGSPKFLREIVCSLAEYKMVNEATGFLNRFPEHTKKEPDFLIAQFVLNAKQVPAKSAVDLGAKLLKQGIQDLAIYEAMIRSSYEANMKDNAEQLIQEAQKRWPANAAVIQALAQELGMKQAA